MKILNAMFGRKKGGIEQAFIDYSESLFNLGCEVTTLAHQDAPIVKSLPQDMPIKTITNFGQWDPLAVWKLKKLIKEIAPDIIITHGSRAAILLNKAIRNIPLVNVCHNYNMKQIENYKSLITVTEDLKKTMIKKGADPSKIYTIPNMINLPSDIVEKDKIISDIPVIGAMGRFVTKKGFNIYLKALSILKNKGLKFKAILGGEGTECDKLKKIASDLGLDDIISFPGWIENKQEFFASIDVFCVPSLHEPFGIVILEAFMNTVPVITTNTEGPSEIVKPHINGLMIEANDPDSLAISIERLIRNSKLSSRIAKEGFNTVKTDYDSNMVAKKLFAVLEDIINQYKEDHSSDDDNLVMIQ